MPQAVAAVAGFVGTVLGGSGAVAGLARIGASLAIQAIVGSRRQPGGGSGREGLTLTVSESDYPRRIQYGQARVGGIRYYLESTGDENEYLHLVLGLAEGPNNGLEAIYFDEQRIDLVADGADANGVTRYKPDPSEEASAPYSDLVRVKYHKGTSDQLADADLVAASAGNWTANHRLRGICYVYVRLQWDRNEFDTGLPEISFLSLGREDIEDPRDSSTGYTTNAALCWRHYLLQEKMGPGAAAAMVDADSFAAAANLCDEAVPLAGGGTEARYTANGMVSMEDHPKDILSDLQAAMAGWRTFAGGKFQLYGGAYQVPTFEVTEDMVVGEVTLRNRPEKRNRHNVVTAVYYASEHRWQFTDAPVREKASYIEEDGEELPLSLQLNLVHKGTHAQRIADIELEKGRATKSVGLTCNLRAFPAVAGQTVQLTLSRYGWNRKVFFVESSQPLFRRDGQCLVNLQLRETSSTIYDWSTSDELPVTEPAPLSNDEPRVTGLTATPGGAVYMTTDFPLDVTLSTLTSGTTIRWSKSAVPADETEGSAYSSPVSMNQGETLYARAFKPGLGSSSPLAEAYQVEQVETPVATPAGGTFGGGDFPLDVTLATATPGASIRYSTTAMPMNDTDGSLYSAPVALTDGQTLYAKAFKAGLVDSGGMTEVYSS